MHEDGSGFAQVAPIQSSGDLSLVGGAGARYFLGEQADPEVNVPTGEVYVDLVAWHENGDPTTRRVLTSDHSLLRIGYRWSADGQHVLFQAKRFDGSGNVVESGAFLGDVEWAGGEPVRIYNERLIASDLPAEHLYVAGFDVDAAGERIAFKLNRDVLDAQGRHVRYETAGLFVAAVPPAAEGQPMPAPASPVEILLSSPDAERNCCFFSPVPDDNRVLFMERASPTSGVRYLWTVDVPGLYDGSYPLVPVQVTTKSNSPANYIHGGPGWSPTGEYIAYAASRSGNWTENHVYKVAANGRGKAVRLTTDTDGYAWPRWRH